MNRLYTAYIEQDTESGIYTGHVPGITGAHTYAETINELHVRLKEVISLCLDEMDCEKIFMLSKDKYVDSYFTRLAK